LHYINPVLHSVLPLPNPSRPLPAIERNFKMINDRREHSRMTMDSSIFVRLNEKQGGLLFDLSEGGLAFDGLTPKSRTAPISLNFHLPATNTTIEARARMVWIDRWNHRIGVRFLDLPEFSRRQLRDWLSASAISHTGHWQKETPIPAAEPRLQVVPSLLPDTAFRNSVPAKNQQPRHLDGLFWGLVFLSSTLFLVAFLMSRTQQPSEAQRIATVSTPSAAASEPAPTPPAPAPVPSPQSPIVSTPPASTPPASSPSASISTHWQLPHQAANAGNFVLQVGAMREESNAVQLSTDLAKRNFQSFVLKRPGDHLFRVNVGPYSDAAAARAVERQLESQGFTAILKSQPPR
jgi:cell division septation protein DedD